MQNTQTTKTTPVENAINIVSGSCAATLVDELREICEDGSLQGICHAIAALGEENRPIEAIIPVSDCGHRNECYILSVNKILPLGSRVYINKAFQGSRVISATFQCSH